MITERDPHQSTPCRCVEVSAVRVLPFVTDDPGEDRSVVDAHIQPVRKPLVDDAKIRMVPDHTAPVIEASLLTKRGLPLLGQVHSRGGAQPELELISCPNRARDE